MSWGVVVQESRIDRDKTVRHEACATGRSNRHHCLVRSLSCGAARGERHRLVSDVRPRFRAKKLYFAKKGKTPRCKL